MIAYNVLQAEKDYWLFLNYPALLDEETKKLFARLDASTDAELIKLRAAYMQECITVYVKRHYPDEWAKVDAKCKELNLQNLKTSEG